MQEIEKELDHEEALLVGGGMSTIEWEGESPGGASNRSKSNSLSNTNTFTNPNTHPHHGNSTLLASVDKQLNKNKT